MKLTNWMAQTRFGEGGDDGLEINVGGDRGGLYRVRISGVQITADRVRMSFRRGAMKMNEPSSSWIPWDIEQMRSLVDPLRRLPLDTQLITRGEDLCFIAGTIGGVIYFPTRGSELSLAQPFKHL